MKRPARPGLIRRMEMVDEFAGPKAILPTHNSLASLELHSRQTRDSTDSEKAPKINLVDLLLRWGNLLSTLAHGALEVRFGPRASTPVAIDVETVERILVNLVQNAASAIRSGGAIRIGLGVEERGVPEPRQGLGSCARMVLTVDDSGDGMTAEQVDRALGRDRDHDPKQPVPRELASVLRQRQTERFVSGYGSWPGCGLGSHDPGAAGEGERSEAGEDSAHLVSELRPQTVSRHGLGLGIVRHLVQTSGGTISIHSKRGLGTRIEMHWPTQAIAADELPAAGIAGKGSPDSGGQGAASQQMRAANETHRRGEEETRDREQRGLTRPPGVSGQATGSGPDGLIAGREGAIAC